MDFRLLSDSVLITGLKAVLYGTQTEGTPLTLALRFVGCSVSPVIGVSVRKSVGGVGFRSTVSDGTLPIMLGDSVDRGNPNQFTQDPQ